MIYDTLANAKLYYNVHPLFKAAFEFLEKSAKSAPDGKTVLKGDDLFANAFNYETSPAADRVFEAHKKYIDLQVLVAGEERLDVVYGKGLKVKQAYTDEVEAELYFPNDEAVNSVILRPGMFTLLFPQDIHRPGCDMVKSQTVRKIVVKIKL